MKASDLLNIARQTPAALGSLSIALVNEPDHWQSVIQFRDGKPRLNPLYRIRSDWPKIEFSPFILHPRLWIKNLETGRSVRVMLDLHSLTFRIDKRNYEVNKNG